MVLQVVGALAAAVKVNYSHTLVDSFTARLHYRWTTTFCLLAGVMVIAKEFIGDPIQCQRRGTDAAKYINTYCWITPTFTINSTNSLGHYDQDIHNKLIHTYYQWVYIVLALQAAFFYLPHYLWKTMEGKQVDHLLQDLNKSLFDEDSDKKIKNTIAYLKESWGMNGRYFFGHFLCESLYLVNVVTQIFIMDKFFNGAFLDYGTKIFEQLSFDDETKNSRFLEVFPRRAKCTFHEYGSSGSIERFDALCIMPQNILNEKIYLAMWLWFIILTVITCIQLLWLLAIYSSNSLRIFITSRLMRTSVIPARVEQALRVMSLGDFCLLNSMGLNLEVSHFRKIMDGVTRAAEEVVYTPSAPVRGTYNTLTNDDTMPRKRNLYPTLS